MNIKIPCRGEEIACNLVAACRLPLGRPFLFAIFVLGRSKPLPYRLFFVPYIRSFWIVGDADPYNRILLLPVGATIGRPVLFVIFVCFRDAEDVIPYKANLNFVGDDLPGVPL